MTLTSLWQDRHPRIEPVPATEVGGHYDVAVVGGGLTGSPPPCCSAGPGSRCVVLEAGPLGYGTTGRSTAKVSPPGHPAGDDREQARRVGRPRLCRGPARGRRVARPVLRGPRGRRCSTGTTSSTPTARAGSARSASESRRPRGARASTSSGRTSCRCPSPRAARCAWPTSSRSTRWSCSRPSPTGHRARRADRRARARRARCAARTRSGWPAPPARSPPTIVVVATNMPILDRGGFFARMKPSRSYCLAFRTGAPVVDAMYLSADQPSRSLRDAPGEDGGPAARRRQRPQGGSPRLGACCASRSCAAGRTTTGRTPSRPMPGPRRTTCRTTACRSPGRCCPVRRPPRRRRLLQVGHDQRGCRVAGASAASSSAVTSSGRTRSAPGAATR